MLTCSGAPQLLGILANAILVIFENLSQEQGHHWGNHQQMSGKKSVTSQMTNRPSD